MAAIRPVDMAVLGLEVRLDFAAGHRPLADLGLAEQEIDDLVLVQRRAQLGGGHRVLLDILREPLAILRLVLRRGLADQPVHLLAADLDAVGGADFRQQQPEPHAALGDLAVIGGFRLDLGQRRRGVRLMLRLVAQLGHDIVILGLDHRRRDREVVAVRQLVEQPPLHVGARQAVEFLLLLVPEQALELVEAFQAEILGEPVVSLGFAGDLHFGRGDGEHRRLALQLLGRIVLGEGHRHVAAFARLNADQPVLEAGDQLARAEFDRHRLAGAALERGVADGTDIVDHDLVAHRRRMALRGCNETLLRGHQLLQLALDRRVVGLDGQPLELEALDLRRGDFGQRLDVHPHFGVLAGRIGLVEFDLRLHRRPDLLLGDQRLDALLHRRVERIGGQRLAVHLADEVGRHLAGAEAGHADLRRHALDLALDAGGDVLGRDGQRVAALEAFIVRFDGLHDCLTRSKNMPAARFSCPAFSGRPVREIGAGEGTRTPTSCDTWT